MTTRLSVHNLSAVYDAPGGGSLPALGPITFKIESGTFVCLIGPSGCGKSTLIRILAGLQRPSAGEALLNDEPIVQPSRRVGLMFQDANLMPWRTVLDNIALPLELNGVPGQERRAQALGLLPRLSLSEDFADAYPGELSGGMAQRVALGRVLIQRPDVLLLDEPFGALDALTREQIGLDLMHVWASDHQTVIMVTHDIHEAILLADRIFVFSSRPGHISADISVPLPRPRQIADSYSAAFGEMAAQVRAAISPE
jgi:NitT/TauT family transport system ATP-binding protein